MQLNIVSLKVMPTDPVLLHDLPLFHGLPRYKGQDYRYWLSSITPASSVLGVLFRWEYQWSKFKPSHAVFWQLNEDFGDDFTMARKKATASVSSERTKSEFKGFINIRLHESDKEAIEALLADSDYVDLIEYLVSWGKLSFSHNNGSVNCTTVVETGDYKGYAISSFAESWQTALVVQGYKLDVYGLRLSEFQTEQPNRPRFG